MPKYKVRVQRIAYGTREIEVVAENSQKAKEEALTAAGNYEFSEHDADYVVERVTEVCETPY